jgi:hypothetical protein
MAALPAARASRPDAPALSRENREAVEAISPETIKRHIATLSADDMEGRDAASRGYLKAAEYAAAEFKRAGAKPGGDNGTFFQDVPTVALQPNPASSVTLIAGGKQTKLENGKDYSASANVSAPTAVDGELVFAGYGISSEQAKWDDYANLDVKDKLVIVLSGAPEGMDRRAGSAFAKMRAAGDKGAKGLVTLVEPEAIGTARPSVMVKGRPIQTRRDPTGRVSLNLSKSCVTPLFEGSGKTLEEAIAVAAKPGAGFSLKSSLKVDLQPAVTADIPNPNVIAYVEGTDPKLKDEYVIYTAHLDHVGIGTPQNGDAIYNGALDNASGSAVVLALAESFAKLPKGPRRTMVFLLVTGEERGFWGSQHYVRNPKWPLSRTAANINIDMIMGWKPSKSLVVSGSEKSTLKQVVTEAAQWLGLSVAEDPFPNERFFYRSDQIIFARAGVPALFLQPGPHWEGMTEEQAKAELQTFLRTRYHRPGDEIQPDWDFRAFQRIAQAAFLMGQRINESDAMPTWNPGDEFEAARLKSIQDGK